MRADCTVLYPAVFLLYMYLLYIHTSSTSTIFAVLAVYTSITSMFLLYLLYRCMAANRETTSRYGPGTLAEMEAALREDRGMAEDAVT